MIELIEVLKAVLFGIVEGVTEWLPISSTGHLILLNEVVKLKVSDEFYSMFEVVIQLGAILAVVVLFQALMFQILLILLKCQKVLLQTVCLPTGMCIKMIIA